MKTKIPILLAIPTCFQTGPIMISAGADKVLTQLDTSIGLTRYCSGDWGALDAEACRMNDQALIDRTGVLGLYRSLRGLPFYIITLPKQNYTMIYLPSEQPGCALG